MPTRCEHSVNYVDTYTKMTSREKLKLSMHT